MQRPFSCFCSHCRKEEFEQCVNWKFTKCNFQEQRLPTNEVENDNEEENEEVTHFNIDDMIDDENEDENDEENQEIEIREENPQLEDLKPDDYVIVSLVVESKKKQKTHLYVAKITKVVDESEIVIDYLEQDFD